MKSGTREDDSLLTGQVAQDLKELVENYLNIGAFEGAIANHLEGMVNRVRQGEFKKEFKLL